MDQRQATEAMAQFGNTAPTEKEILVRRIDADIRKLQEWRAYVLGDPPAATDATVAEKKARKPRKKRGMPESAAGGF